MNKKSILNINVILFLISIGITFFFVFIVFDVFEIFNPILVEEDNITLTPKMAQLLEELEKKYK